MARKSRQGLQFQTAVPTQREERIYKAALYARISVENEKKRETDSIGIQLQMLKDFASERSDMQVYDIYCDDDISGTDFIRPEFARMMNDARDGKVNCIIVKDLSRLGRNHIETGEYIEMIFPFMRIRFIAITDRFDTLHRQADISVQIKNVANERYARDISKKICSTMTSMQKQGKFVGSKAPYGYLRDPQDKHHFVIDSEAAPVVHELFEMIAQGCTLHYAATTMNARGIPSPGRHNYDLGLVKSDKFKNSLWYQQTVRRILMDKVYLGWLIGGKFQSDFYSSGKKDSVPLPEEEWIITKGAHEAIVTKELFDKVQQYFVETKEKCGAATKYDCKSKQASMFKGHLRCGECGKAMFLRAKNGHGNKTWWYYCTLHENYNSSYCKKKAVKKETLEHLVLTLIQAQMQLFLDARATIAALNQRETSKKRFTVYQNQIQVLRRQIEAYAAEKARLYKASADGEILGDEYMQASQECSAKSDELKIFLSEIEKEAQKFAPEYVGSEKWAALIDEYSGCTELNAEMVDAFIDEVVLYNDGRADVHFKFKDEMEAVLLMASLRQKEAQRYVG